MERALEPRAQGQRRADERNDTRAAVRELFPQRECATLVRPAADEEELRHAVTSTALRGEFMGQLDALRQSVRHARYMRGGTGPPAARSHRALPCPSASPPPGALACPSAPA